MNISYDAYRVFYYVAQYRSFTKAAQMLYSNQPNVTRTIKQLEQSLGCILFIRSNRGVTLTPEGERFYTHISAAMEQIQAGEQALLSDTSLQSGIISIGASEIALHHTLLPVLEQFRRQYPGVRLRIFNSNTKQAVHALKDRLVDFSLVTTPLGHDDGFVRRDLAAFRDAAVCGGVYVELAQQELSLEQLCRYPLISLGKGTVTHQLYSDYFRQRGLILTPDIEAATSDQILPMVCANLGVGFVPEHSAKEAVKDGNVFVVNLRDPLPERGICLLKHKDMPLSIAARELEKMILQFSVGEDIAQTPSIM